MSWSQTDLDAIEAAIKTGSSRVQYADRSVQYRDLDELLRIRDMIRGELGMGNGGNGRSYAYASFNKGLR